MTSVEMGTVNDALSGPTSVARKHCILGGRGKRRRRRGRSFDEEIGGGPSTTTR